MTKTPAMSAIKDWYRQRVGAEDIALDYLLTGFSLGIWMGSMHPEVREKLEDEMPDETVAHDKLTEELFKEIYSND